MFWNHNSASSQIDSLLAKEDVTLQEVMDSDDIINDCRGQNKCLIDYLQRSNVMRELVELTTTEPPPDLDERTKYKYPNIACELLTCDIPILNERLARDEELLEKLYNFLENEPPLNPLLASFFSKIMGALIAKKTEQNWLSNQLTCLQVLDFLKTRDNFIPSLLKHLGTSAIMDLMLKLMTQVEGADIRQNALNWLDSQTIIQQLVCLLNPEVEKERHYNAAQLLCDFVRIARDNQRNCTERIDPDPLLNTLESPETVSLLLENILSEEKCETAIVGGIQVLLAILDVNQTSIPYPQNMYNSNINEDVDIEHKQKVLANTTDAIRKHIKDFHNLLLDPPKKTPINSTIGMLDPPLGNTRLQVTRLFASLLSSNNKELLLEIVSLGTFPVILDLFFKYSWNNFLHTQVEACLVSALKTYVSEDTTEVSNALCNHLLVDCKLVSRILDAWRENDHEQKDNKGVRKGYMGHLTRLANKFVELCSTTSLGQYFKDNLPEVAKSFDEFKETTLSETNKVAESLLGGVRVCGSNPNNFNDDDYSDILSSQNQTLQMFSQYQMQNLAPQYAYTGFGDDAFNDEGDTILSIRSRTEADLDLSDGDSVQQQELFKQVCAQNINTLDDADDQIFEDKEHTFQTVIEKPEERNEPTFSSSDSDSDGDEQMMDVDPWQSPKTVNVTPLVMSDPWSGPDLSNPDANDVDAGGWADFTAAAFDDVCNSKSDDLGEPTKVESDVKVDNMETDCMETESEKVAGNSFDGKIAAEKEKEELQKEQEMKNEIAAGDQCGIPSVDQKITNVSLEPSISAPSKVGDNCVMQTETNKELMDTSSKTDKDNV